MLELLQYQNVSYSMIYVSILFSKIYYYFVDRNTYEEEFLNLIVEEDKRKIARDRIEKMMGKHDLLNVYKEGHKETLGQMIIRQR